MHNKHTSIKKIMKKQDNHITYSIEIAKLYEKLNKFKNNKLTVKTYDNGFKQKLKKYIENEKCLNCNSSCNSSYFHSYSSVPSVSFEGYGSSYSSGSVGSNFFP